ncbi:MAG: sugar transferase [bacterium]
MRKRSELFFNLISIPFDALALIASWTLAFVIRVEYSAIPTVYQIPGREFVGAMVVLAPISILFFALAGLYNFDSTRSRWQEYGRVMIAVSASTMFLIIDDFFTTKPLFPSKAVVIYGFGLSIIAVIGTRFIVSVIQRWLMRFNIGVRRVVIVGTGDAADSVTYALQRQRGYKVVSTIGDARENLKRLQDLFKKSKVDEIILADYDLSAKLQVELIQLTHKYHVGYKYVPTVASLYQTRSHSGLIADLPFIEVVRTPLDGWWRIYKTVFEFIFATIGVIILSPVFLIIAIIIKLTDKGPVFYKHGRIGRDGKLIQVWKFRSMYTEFSTGPGFSQKSDSEILKQIGGDNTLVEEFAKDQKLKNDPRVTPIGRFIRRTSLDEFPQLINVLRGELSLIGPRPVTEAELKRYGDNVPTFLLIKPGITGLWQVSGRNDVSYEERVRLDVYYVENWSALQDLRILFRTVIVMLFGKGY